MNYVASFGLIPTVVGMNFSFQILQKVAGMQIKQLPPLTRRVTAHLLPNYNIYLSQVPAAQGDKNNGILGCITYLSPKQVAIFLSFRLECYL